MYPRQSPTTHTEQLGNEVAVYDRARAEVHALNPTAAGVWRRCDGATSPEAIAAALARDMVPEAEAVVDLTLRELARLHLLELPVDSRADRPARTRRWLLGRGVAAAMLPAIYSIVAPPPAAAQSVPTGTASFAFTVADQTFVVPGGVVAITIVANGAQGGLGFQDGLAPSGTGGLGGRTTATVSVTPGASLIVRVGGVGPDGGPIIATPGGFNGGGGSQKDGGGGGGASSVRDGATPLVVAGGGGGGGAAKDLNKFGANGGAGGGLDANTGQILSGAAGPGGGGGQSSGGLGGFGIGGGLPGTNGMADQGGVGGEHLGFVGGGGGGGGHFGGGGGGGGSQTNDIGGGGGGGGSSFTALGATGVLHEQGVKASNGFVTISW